MQMKDARVHQVKHFAIARARQAARVNQRMDESALFCKGFLHE
jgi:hypothetical protein